MRTFFRFSKLQLNGIDPETEILFTAEVNEVVFSTKIFTIKEVWDNKALLFDESIDWKEQKTDMRIKVYHIESKEYHILIYEGIIALKKLQLPFQEDVVLTAQKLVVPCANVVYEGKEPGTSELQEYQVLSLEIYIVKKVEFGNILEMKKVDEEIGFRNVDEILEIGQESQEEYKRSSVDKETEPFFLIFGSDQHNYIYKFFFVRKVFEKMIPPRNLKLFGYSLAANIDNGEVLISGGIDHSLKYINGNLFLYNPWKNTARQLPCMLQARYTHTVAVKDHFFYVMGGRYYGKGVSGVLKSCERFNMQTLEWSKIPDLNTKKCTSTAIRFGSYVYMFGGYTGAGRSNSIERIYCHDNSDQITVWEKLSLLLPSPIEAGQIQSYGNDCVIYIGGKTNSQYKNNVFKINLKKLSIEKEGKLRLSRVLSKCGMYKDSIFIFGGNSMNYEEFDIELMSSKKCVDFSKSCQDTMKIFSFATPSISSSEDSQTLTFFPRTQEYNPLTYSLITSKFAQNNQQQPQTSGQWIHLHSNKSLFISLTESYIQNNETITTVSLPSFQRQGFALTKSSGNEFVYLIGGKDNTGSNLTSVEKYNIKKDEWQLFGNMLLRKNKPRACCLDRDLYVLESVKEGSYIERYDGARRKWEILIKLPKELQLVKFIHGFIYKEKHAILLINDQFCQVITNKLVINVENSVNFDQVEHFLFGQNKQIHCFYKGGRYRKVRFEESELKIVEICEEKEGGQKKSLLSENYSLLQLQKQRPQQFLPQILPIQTKRLFLFRQQIPQVLEFDFQREIFKEFEFQPKIVRIYEQNALVGVENGAIVISGGVSECQNGVTVVSKAYKFNPFTKKEQEIQPMPQPRYAHKMILYKGQVLCYSGYESYDQTSLSTSIFSYSYTKNRWTKFPSLLGQFSKGDQLQAFITYTKLMIFTKSKNVTVVQQFSEDFQKFEKVFLYPNNVKPLIDIHFKTRPLENNINTHTGYHLNFCSNKLTKLSQTNQTFQHNDKIYLFSKGHQSNIWRFTIGSTLFKQVNKQRIDLNKGKLVVSEFDISSNNFEVRKKEFSKLYIFGIHSFKHIIIFDMKKCTFSKIPLPKGFHYFLYSQAVTLPDGKIILNGGITSSLKTVSSNN